ncbi:MAG: cation-translocating P-type ATPase [Clostridia bacterium]|nr:cation-translocating P-type ATPase [Clostridia bacterium]
MAYSEAIEQTEKRLNTNRETGLKPKEAKKRLAANGANKLKEKKKKGIVLLFFEQFNDFLILILIAAACISFFTSIIDNDGDIAEPVVIMAIVVFNAVLGVIQEHKAEKSLEALKKMSAPVAAVIRGGKEIRIPSEEVVTGDILIISAGDVVAADVRLFETVNLELDESALTGESVPVQKNGEKVAEPFAPMAERTNMAYSGTYVTAGKGKGIVSATGMDTEVGKIAFMLSDSVTVRTPLQKKLEHVGKVLGLSALGICALVFVLGVFHKFAPFDMFVMSVSLAVAAIPEGLPAIVTVMLSIGVQKMAKNGAIVRNLPAVETLGSADVICTDKTGTLTENKMSVREVYGNEESTLEWAMLCCSDNTKNPTELAILKECEDRNIKCDITKTDEEPFSSKTKQMRVLTSKGLAVKGAPEVVLGMCSHTKNSSGTEPMSDLKRREILSANRRFASEALRVIAVACKINATKLDDNNLVFCGLIAMSDPPRKEAEEAVRLCKSGGIRPVMITGDHRETAFAIAQKVGIANSRDECILGRNLDMMSDTELKAAVEKYNVFARTTPEHKVKIVKALRDCGKVVAMTGDGVNDAPALKNADIGCSLGIAGTDVAKASSDMVLTDDNFATIVKAVRLGREIYENIKKSVRFLLSSNIGEIITVFISILIGLPVPLTALQLLWINLITDSLPAIALGVDPPDRDLLSEGKNKGGLFDFQTAVSIVLEGVLIGALSLFAFTVGINIHGSLTVGRTMAFCVLNFSQLLHAFNTRTSESILGKRFFKNKLLILSLVVGILLQLAVVCIFPELFGTVSLTGKQWNLVCILSVMPVIIVELQKAFNKYFRK